MSLFLGGSTVIGNTADKHHRSHQEGYHAASHAPPQAATVLGAASEYRGYWYNPQQPKKIVFCLRLSVQYKVYLGE